MRQIENITVLHNFTTIIEGIEYPSLEIQVAPGDDSLHMVDKLGLEWIATNQTDKTLLIQLYFEHPHLINSNS